MILFSLLILLAVNAESARILCIFPMPSLSHQIVFRALTNALVERGHEIVVVTPNPIENTHKNLTQINTSESYEILKEGFSIMKGERGIVLNSDTIREDEYMFFKYLESVTITKEEFQAILQDGKQKFDLVIAESLFISPIMLAKIYNAPFIWISSFYGTPYNYEVLGAPSFHPLLYPYLFRSRIYNLSFWEKLRAVYVELNLYYQTNIYLQRDNEILKHFFGSEALSVNELEEYIDLLFVNSNSMFQDNRPVPPNIIQLGALHMEPVKKMPQDLQTYLDNSKRGVIYVSMGTNVQVQLMDSDLLQAFLDAFEALPFDVLWKFDGADLPYVPKNVRVQKWFPQRDLLAHPNIKAFVTQGGLQSTDEAIDSEVPLVGLPCLGDQWYNVEQYEKHGIGIKVDVLTMTADDLVRAVNKVVGDVSYKKNIQKLNKIIKDQPQTSIERAVWWTEYVIRHKGAKHLRSAAALTSWFDYLILDVVLFVLSIVLVVAFSVFFAIRFVVRKLKGMSSPKKVKKN